jgi:hypothetical protein
MTRQEHFEQWIKRTHPYVPLCYDKEKDCYIGTAFLAYQAWKEAPLRRPCEKGLISKEQRKELKEKGDPKTLVDRLNGWYSQTSEPYKVPKIQEEAAREIMRLREEIERLKA